MLAFVTPCQLQILVRRLLCLLDESVQQDHSAFPIDVKKYARNSVLHQARPHFINAIASGLANGHPDGPAKLHRLDILTDTLAVFG
jgi:hypothetical protein